MTNLLALTLMGLWSLTTMLEASASTRFLQRLQLLSADNVAELYTLYEGTFICTAVHSAVCFRSNLSDQSDTSSAGVIGERVDILRLS